MKRDFWRVTAEADLAGVLQAGQRVGRPIQSSRTHWTAGEDLKFVHAVIEWIRIRSGPMLLVLCALGHRPDFVAAVIDPATFGFGRRNVLAFVTRIDEEVRMAVKGHLHEAASELRHDGEPYPIIPNFLGFPCFESRGANLA